MIGVTNETRDKVDAYVARNAPKYPIVIESVDSSTTFGLQRGFPTQYLITPDGRIGWAGNFFDQAQDKDEILAKHLRDVRLAPDLPKALDPVEKLIERRRYAEARAALAKAAADEKADAAVRKAAEETVKWIDDRAAVALASAEEAEKSGDFAAAAATCEQAAADFAGLDAGSRAAKALEVLLADPAKKKEVDATRALAKAQEQARELSPKKAVPLFRAVAAKYKDTRAGARAAQIAAELETKAGK